MTDKPERSTAGMHILIVDDEDAAIERIAGLLLRVHATWPADVARSLAEARVALSQRVPHVVLLDPEIATPDESIAFLRESVSAHSSVQWIINTHDRWWRRNRQQLLADSLSELARGLRCLNKGFTYARGRERLAAVLAQCANEVAERRLGASGQIAPEAVIGAGLREAQTLLRTNLMPLLDVIAGEPATRDRRAAFVSTQFDQDGHDRFEMVFLPALKNLGYWPVIMFDQSKYNSQSMPAAVFGHIGRSDLYVADLTGERPDVLLEVGAAWMAGIPMVLVASRSTDVSRLPAIVRTQHINFYDSYPDLRDKLRGAIDQA
jgi:hypothetical protein